MRDRCARLSVSSVASSERLRAQAAQVLKQTAPDHPGQQLGLPQLGLEPESTGVVDEPQYPVHGPQDVPLVATVVPNQLVEHVHRVEGPRVEDAHRQGLDQGPRAATVREHWSLSVLLSAPPTPRWGVTRSRAQASRLPVPERRRDIGTGREEQFNNHRFLVETRPPGAGHFAVIPRRDIRHRTRGAPGWPQDPQSLAATVAGPRAGRLPRPRRPDAALGWHRSYLYRRPCSGKRTAKTLESAAHSDRRPRRRRGTRSRAAGASASTAVIDGLRRQLRLTGERDRWFSLLDARCARSRPRARPPEAPPTRRADERPSSLKMLRETVKVAIDARDDGAVAAVADVLAHI